MDFVYRNFLNPTHNFSKNVNPMLQKIMKNHFVIGFIE